MPVPVVCHECGAGRFRGHGADTYACRSCGFQAAASQFVVQSDERLVVVAGILQVLTVPDGHQVITPTLRSHAPHLGANLALALRLDMNCPVFHDVEAVREAEHLLAALDVDERGPWVLSPVQLEALTRAMDARYALLPSASRYHPAFDAEIRAAHARSRHPRTT